MIVVIPVMIVVIPVMIVVIKEEIWPIPLSDPTLGTGGHRFDPRPAQSADRRTNNVSAPRRGEERSDESILSGAPLCRISIFRPFSWFDGLLWAGKQPFDGMYTQRSLIADIGHL